MPACHIYILLVFHLLSSIICTFTYATSCLLCAWPGIYDGVYGAGERVADLLPLHGGRAAVALHRGELALAGAAGAGAELLAAHRSSRDMYFAGTQVFVVMMYVMM